MLVRGSQNARTDTTSSKYDLFGTDYATVNGGNDKGTTIQESQLPAQTLNRIRKVYAATVQVRNLCYVDSTRGTCVPPP